MRRTASRRRPYHAQSNALTPLGLLVGVLTVVAVIFACMWQHKAATAGRALGIPSRHSPAWGVGSWFVPVVNLWMPVRRRARLPPARDIRSGPASCTGGSPGSSRAC